MTSPYAESTEPASAEVSSGTEGEEQEPAERQGPLLDELDLKKVAAVIIAKVDAQKRGKAKLGAVVRRNKAWGRGVRGVKIVEETDREDFKVTAPVGSKNSAPIPNKVAKLLEKTVALLTADRPIPEVPPQSGDDADVNAAAFATRLLQADSGENGSNDTGLVRSALSIAGYYKSAFLYAIVNPSGGGRHPVEVHCHPAAQQYDANDPAACLRDPQTGEPIADDAAVIKYLHPDSSLKAAKAGAQMRWVNKVEPDIVTSELVWLHPPTCRGIADADAVTVGRVMTLGQAKAQYPSLAEMDEAKLSDLCRWRPSVNVRAWLAAEVDDLTKEKQESGTVLKDADDTLSDDNLLFGYHHYQRQSDQYPRGAYVCVLGGKDVPQRSPWAVTVGEDDSAEDIALDLPLAQFRWKDDAIDRNPMGISGAEELGAMDELRAAQLLAALEWLYRFNRPIQFLPAGSPLQGKNIAQARENQNFVAVNMDGSGRPIVEDVPPLPPMVMQIYDGMGSEMDEAAGVPKSIQGLTQTGVSSGRMQNQQIEQALQVLAPIFQNTEDGLCRWWRLKMQLWRGFYDVPRLAKLGSDGGSYEQRAWSGADLNGATDVRIARGSFTALSATAKREMAAAELQLAYGTKDPEVIREAWDRYLKATQRGLSTTLGMEDDPIEQRIKRQVAAWEQGPPASLVAKSQAWQQQQQQQQAAMQQAQMAAQQIGQPMAPPPPQTPDPMAAAAQAVFAPIASDAYPQVAKVRLRALIRAQQTVRYERAHPTWRQALDAALEAAKAGAGLMTAQESQQAQQTAQQTQMQAAQQQIAAKGQADTQKAVVTANAQAEAELKVQRENDQRDTARLMLQHQLKAQQSASDRAEDRADDPDQFAPGDALEDRREGEMDD